MSAAALMQGAFTPCSPILRAQHTLHGKRSPSAAFVVDISVQNNTPAATCRLKAALVNVAGLDAALASAAGLNAAGLNAAAGLQGPCLACAATALHYCCTELTCWSAHALAQTLACPSA